MWCPTFFYLCTMDTLESAFKIDLHNPWLVFPALLFGLLITYFFIKFFSVFFQFIQAKGCLTVLLITLVGLPGIVAITLLSGYTFVASILILLAVIGVITGYIARDSEENVGKFGNFIMIVSITTLILALFLVKFV
ncbi:MAG: hypothetical protein M0R39_13790 [Prolixibacteraceae bacterium]|nr:hypothetical protein [Prolixibacteraceae bacterium]